MSPSHSLAPSGAAALAAFLRRAWAALAFGFLLTFSSAVGQSYFIGLFGAEIRTALSLSHGEFGGIYAAATLASAGALLFAGKLTDRLSPRAAGLLTAAWLTGAALLMAFVAHPVMLLLALFALRLGGQGMMSHIALTTLARWFTAERGRAVALATLGFPAAEALLPPLVALGLAGLGAGSVWLLAAAVLALVVAPTILALSLKAESNRARDEAHREASEGTAPAIVSWTRAQVLKDPRFYAVCPSLLAAPFIVTGIVFHQARLADVNGWSLPEFASLFVLFAAASVLAGLLVGAATDRFGAKGVLPVFLLPLCAALLVFSLTDALAAAGLAMALMGLSAGGATVLFGTVWAELYGPKHLGAIRALAVSLMVLATALAPAVLGALIDLGVGLDTQFLALAIYVLVCIAVVLRVRPRLVACPPPGAPL